MARGAGLGFIGVRAELSWTRLWRGGRFRADASVGHYAGNQADGDFRLTPVWAVSSDSTWRVVAAHSTVVA